MKIKRFLVAALTVALTLSCFSGVAFATEEVIRYNINYAGTSVKFLPDDEGNLAESAEPGDFVVFALEVEDGFELEKISAKTAGGEDVNIITMATMESVTYRFTMPEDDVTVSAVAVPVEVDSYTVYYEGDHVKFLPVGANELVESIIPNKLVVFALEVEDGFELEKISAKTAGGEDVNIITMSTMESVAYRFTMPEDDVTVSAVVSPVETPEETPVPKTGDESNPGVFLVLMLAGAYALFFVLRKIRQ